MKALPTVNQKSIYQAAGQTYADVKNDETITDPIVKHTLALKALCIQKDVYLGELKRRQLDQIDSLNNIKTESRIVEVKAFDQIPIEEHRAEG